MNSPSNEKPLAGGPGATDEESPQSGLRAVIAAAIGETLRLFIRYLVRFTGRSVVRKDAPWLDCPLGKPGRIGTGVYQKIATDQGLGLSSPPDAGLENFETLRGPSFNPESVDPRIRHFYEHTALYHLEVWSEVYFTGKFVLWLLVEFVSRRMDQLNFPISSLEVAKGMTSEIVQLCERGTGRVVSTGWLRRFRSTGQVIYAGLYSETRVPGEENPCVKVTFPCDGSANVYLRPVAYADGSFGLDSHGGGFGKAGFYRLMEDGPDAWIVRYFSTLHEIFHVYVDEEGVLRTDHEVHFMGFTVLRLHYKMTLSPDAINNRSPESSSLLQPV